ncbi:replicative DNA helicase [Candidatus Vidania fulgoroideorum]
MRIFSKEVEQFILGFLITKNISYKIIKKVEDKDFFFKKNRFLFKIIKKLSLKYKNIDIGVILNYLDKKNIYFNINYINEVVTNIPLGLNIKNCLKILKRKSNFRRFYKILNFSINNLKKIGLKKIVIYLQKKIEEIFYKKKDKIVDLNLGIKNIIKEKIEFFDSGYKNLNRLNIKYGDFIIVAGRPSSGKTSLVLNICKNVSIKNSVLFFSMEMTSNQIISRIISLYYKIFNNEILKKIKKGGGKRLKKLKLLIDDSCILTPLKLKLKIKEVLNKHKNLKLVVIDYIQLMRSDYKKDNRNNEITEISRFLKIIAKEFNLCVIGVSQLNRNSEQRISKIPIISDLRESGALEQDADIVILIHNEEIDFNKSISNIIVAKNRNGETFNFKLKFLKKYTRFEE